MTETYNLVVESIGSASPRVVNALQRGLHLPEFDLVRRLYQAPAVLLAGVSEPLASGEGELLGQTGLRTRIVPSDAPFSPGQGDRDVALHIRNPARLREVIAEISAFLGVDGQTALTIATGAPAALVGRVSAATVEALIERFRPLEVEIDASLSENARYDLFVQDLPAPMRAELERALRAQGVTPIASGPLLARDLTRAVADGLWARYEHRVPMRLLDQAFQRFDIRLDKAPDTPAFAALLSELAGMPPEVVPKVLRRLPLVVVSGVRHADFLPLMGRLTEAGARATAHLVTLQHFNLVIEGVRDLKLTAAVLAALTDKPVEAQQTALRRLPLHLDGPLSGVRARWMRHELKSTGATVRMEER